MTLVEAIKNVNGRRFKRKGDVGWWYLDAVNVLVHVSCPRPWFSHKDIIAKDWEVENEKRLLSWEEIDKALEYYVLGDVKHKLGFK